MTSKTEGSIGGITGRNTLESDVAVSSRLAFGGAAIGTVGVICTDESENVIPVELFVRPEPLETDKSTPRTPTAEGLLVERADPESGASALRPRRGEVAEND